MKLDLDSCMQHINEHVTNQVQNNTAERERERERLINDETEKRKRNGDIHNGKEIERTNCFIAHSNVFFVIFFQFFFNYNFPVVFSLKTNTKWF